MKRRTFFKGLLLAPLPFLAGSANGRPDAFEASSAGSSPAPASTHQGVAYYDTDFGLVVVGPGAVHDAAMIAFENGNTEVMVKAQFI